MPVHVRCLIDEAANIGQIPRLEKLVATIRSREISCCLVLQAQSQLKALYKDNADTIIGNMDTMLFLGGREPGTLKEWPSALKECEFMNPKILKLRGELEKNKEKISGLQSRCRELEKQIRELEDTDIIGMVRENGMTMEQFAELFRRMQNAPLPTDSMKEEPVHEEV